MGNREEQGEENRLVPFQEFARRAFTAAGLENFVDIIETGSHLLTMEFLATLLVEVKSTETKIYFWLFNEFFEMTPKELSVSLGFNKECIVDLVVLISDHNYDCSVWWSESPMNMLVVKIAFSTSIIPL